MPAQRKSNVKQRARQIKRASKPKSTVKEYLQYTLVILVILGILIAALILSDTI